MAAIVASLPLQLVCQLIVTGSAPSFTENVTLVHSNLVPVSPSPPSQTRMVVIPGDYTVYPDVGTAYKIYNESVLWKIARRRCISEGGTLAVIDSAKKFEYVSSQRKSKGVTHVGIHSFFDDSEWVSVKTGLPLNYIPWASGEPNGKYRCAMVKHERGGLGNFNCDTAMGDFICEISIPGENEAQEDQSDQIVIN